MSGATIGSPSSSQLDPVLALRIAAWSAACRRMTELLSDQRGRVQWWVELGSQLDVLAEGLAGFATDRGLQGEAADTEGAEVVGDPQKLGWLSRLDGEWQQLTGHTAAVRALVSRYAGDPMAVGAVAGSVKELMLLVHRFQERSTELLLWAGEKIPAPRIRP